MSGAVRVVPGPVAPIPQRHDWAPARAALASLEPGQGTTVACPSGMKKRAAAAAMAGIAHTAWGPGTYNLRTAEADGVVTVTIVRRAAA